MTAPSRTPEGFRTIRIARMALGRCRYCSRAADGGTRMCWQHRIYQAAWKYAKRQAAKLNARTA